MSGTQGSPDSSVLRANTSSDHIPHSSAAFLHHLHTDQSSHHITLSASTTTTARHVPSSSRAPPSISNPLEPPVLQQNKPTRDGPGMSPTPRAGGSSPHQVDGNLPVAGSSTLKPLVRASSKRNRPKTAPSNALAVDKDELPDLSPSPDSRHGELVDTPDHPQNAGDEGLMQLTHAQDACVAIFAQDEAGLSDAKGMMTFSGGGGESIHVLLGKAGSLKARPTEESTELLQPPSPLLSDDTRGTGGDRKSWRQFSEAYALGLFDPNKIPNPPTMSSPFISMSSPPFGMQSSHSNPGEKYKPPIGRVPRSSTTGSSSSVTGSIGTTSTGTGTPTSASSAPSTSGEGDIPPIAPVKPSSMAMAIAARKKAFELENLPNPARLRVTRPDEPASPSYSLAAATVRMASHTLREHDFAPLALPSPERELMDPMASVFSPDTGGAKRESASSDPGHSGRFALSRSMSSAVTGTGSFMEQLPTIAASPVSTPYEHPRLGKGKAEPELKRGQTSPLIRTGRGGIVNTRIPAATAPLEKAVEVEVEGDYFGSAVPRIDRQVSYTSASSSSHTATAEGTPMPVTRFKSPEPEDLNQVDANNDVSEPAPLPPPVAHAHDMGRLYEELGWLPAPLPPNEAARRKALYRFSILHTASDVNFDRIAHMTKLVFSSKIVLIALIDNDTQWHKSHSGLGADEASRISSFCSHSVLSKTDEPFVVQDAAQDWRFANNPQVVGPPYVRFYAGAPLRTSDGHNVGSLCIIDDKPRAEFPPRLRLILKELAAVAMREMELWRDKLQLRIRDKIQTSMERFTRECLEMDASSTGSNAEASAKMDHVYARAASLVCSTLDMEGCFILDIGQFEMTESDTPTGRKVIYRADPYIAESSPFLERSDEFGPVNPFPVLASNPSTVPSRPISAAEHEKLSEFLRENRDGRIFENVAPSWMRYMFPPGIRYGMCVPVFGVDQQPFAMLCAYTCNKAKQYLEGYELQFLRAIGVIILSAVLRRRMVLADKTKSILISSVSHELRTPLHGILAAAELLSDTELDSNQISFLKTVQTCGNSLIETVNHVLDFTKLSGSSQSSGSTIKLARVNLAHLVESTVEGCWIGQRARFFHGDSDIGSFYAPEAPSGLVPRTQRTLLGEKLAHVETVIDIAQREQGWMVSCEKGGLRRVLMNLVGNSLKFTQDGYVQITLRELPHAPGDKRIPIEMAVIDTGKGIGKSFLKDGLFHPFSQENPLQAGTGLGLAIVNSIVRSENVNGKVDVWSSEGVGTEIRVSFDVDVIDEDEELSSASSSTSHSSNTAQGHSLSLLGFTDEHRGHMLSLEILGAYAAEWLFELKDDGEIVVINDDESILVTLQHHDGPILFLQSNRNPKINVLREKINRNGGYCQTLHKPIGPSLFRKALRDAVQWMDDGTNDQRSDAHRPSFSRDNSGASADSAESNESSTTVSDFSHSKKLQQLRRESRLPLTRRRSEEQDQQAPRPSMAPRGVTYHAPRRSVTYAEPTSSESPAPSSGSPHSSSPTSTVGTMSTISLADGGVMLKAAVNPNAAPPKTRVARVMVVEDNVINRRVLGAFLQKRGYEYAEAHDGQAGVELFESSPANFWDVILMDISMPIMNGHEATRAIRRLESKRRLTSIDHPTMPLVPNKLTSAPIIQDRAKIFALTGLATPDDKREAFAGGVDGYLVKPVSLASLDVIFKKLGL